MSAEQILTSDDVARNFMATLAHFMNLDNGIQHDPVKEEGNSMPKRLKEKVLVNGKERWIDGYSNQELMDNYVRLLEKEGLIERVDPDDSIPIFGEYMDEFYSTYKTDQESLTIQNRMRIIENHIRPKFGSWRMSLIRTTDIQKWYNELGKKYSKETILKIKNIMSPVLDAAVEDDILTKNPMKSRRLVIAGKESVSHKALPKATMERIRSGLPECDIQVLLMGGLLSYTGMRFEEVLGMKWEDISNGEIYIQRAVVHPKRNQPEVKKPKTESSIRRIPYPGELMTLIEGHRSNGYLLPSMKDRRNKTPMSYSEARRVFERFRSTFDILEYTAHDFRDTCATEWREKGIPLDMIARLLGHSKTETTERRYVKYRTEGFDQIRDKL